MLLRHFRQTQRVAGGTHQNCGSNLLDRSQALQRVHASTRNGERTLSLSPFISGPETNEWTKPEGQKDNIIPAHARCAVDAGPAIGPPIPAFLRIEYFQGTARGARSLVKANILA